MSSPRAVDVLLFKVTLIALLPTIALVYLAQAWGVVALTIASVYTLALSSCLYRLTPIFRHRNHVSRFVLREQGQLRVCSLAGLFDFQGNWQSITLADIDSVSLSEHRIDINTKTVNYSLSVVGEAQQLRQHMQSVLADTKVKVIN
ncbi:hypothetical protein AAEU32_01305 [Pseudoalteromonas sp. SSDWG2]|uniref:hypothetical protein n=1 Tax=Pseudoalteromonas sp. SSDWG2 TaxID=3139391 RepID=UPI003BAB5D1D